MHAGFGLWSEFLNCTIYKYSLCSQNLGVGCHWISCESVWEGYCQNEDNPVFRASVRIFS